MRFALTPEQRDFGAALHDLLDSADVPSAARAWAAGDHAPGLAIWRKLAASGVTALAVPEHAGGLGASPVDLVVACEELGRYPVPGPIAESVAAVPALLAAVAGGQTGKQDAGGDLAPWLERLADGSAIAALAMPPAVPYALDADVAEIVLLAEASPPGVWLARPGACLASADRARRLFEVSPAREVGIGGANAERAVRSAARHGTLASAALLHGAGQGLLEAAVRHAKTREQFGRPIGAFQAVKHALADAAIGLEFARPLMYAAAAAMAAASPTTDRDVSAARVACADAARLAARIALQVHGAIGYTLECDVSLWLAKVRSLSATWGSQAEHRAAVLAALSGERTGPWN